MSEQDVFDIEGRKERISEVQKRLANRNAEDLRRIMNMVEGRRFMWTLLSDSGVFRDSFDQNGLVMARLNGARRVGLDLLKRITPEEELRMKSEARSDKLIRETELSNAEKENKAQ